MNRYINRYAMINYFATFGSQFDDKIPKYCLCFHTMPYTTVSQLLFKDYNKLIIAGLSKLKNLSIYERLANYVAYDNPHFNNVISKHNKYISINIEKIPIKIKEIDSCLKRYKISVLRIINDFVAIIGSKCYDKENYTEFLTTLFELIDNTIFIVSGERCYPLDISYKKSIITKEEDKKVIEGMCVMLLEFVKYTNGQIDNIFDFNHFIQKLAAIISDYNKKIIPLFDNESIQSSVCLYMKVSCRHIEESIEECSHFIEFINYLKTDKCDDNMIAKFDKLTKSINSLYCITELYDTCLNYIAWRKFIYIFEDIFKKACLKKDLDSKMINFKTKCKPKKLSVLKSAMEIIIYNKKDSDCFELLENVKSMIDDEFKIILKELSDTIEEENFTDMHPDNYEITSEFYEDKRKFAVLCRLTYETTTVHDLITNVLNMFHHDYTKSHEYNEKRMLENFKDLDVNFDLTTLNDVQKSTLDRLLSNPSYKIKLQNTIFHKCFIYFYDDITASLD